MSSPEPAEASPRPRVLLNFASSLDGKINPEPGVRTGRFVMSRHPEDWRRMVALRAQCQAVLVGASNIRVDDPPLALSREEREARRARGQPEPARIVVTTRGDGLTPAHRMFDPALGGPPCVVHTTRMPAPAREALGRVARLIELGTELVPMPELLSLLAGEGVRTVLCEGGGELVAHLFAARAVDEIYLTLVPRVLGGARAPTLVGGAGLGPDEVPEATLADLERVGDELFLRYQIAW